jgi:hypothetical protein
MLQYALLAQEEKGRFLSSASLFILAECLKLPNINQQAVFATGLMEILPFKNNVNFTSALEDDFSGETHLHRIKFCGKSPE